MTTKKPQPEKEPYNRLEALIDWPALLADEMAYQHITYHLHSSEIPNTPWYEAFVFLEKDGYILMAYDEYEYEAIRIAAREAYFHHHAITRKPARRAKAKKTQSDQTRGRNNEHAVLDALIRAPDNSLLHWITLVRPATHEEDHRGIDLVVETRRFGELYIQVKSSHNAMKKFRKKHRDDFIGMITLERKYPPHELRAHIYRELERIREELHIHRGRPIV